VGKKMETEGVGGFQPVLNVFGYIQDNFYFAGVK